MDKIQVSLTFHDGFHGELKAKNSVTKIGSEEGSIAPYDMMLGALGSCYYATFMDIVKKKRLVYDKVTIEISGVKREEIPTTLKNVDMIVTVYGATSEKGFEQTSKLAAKYCSVHETISKVADINLILKFNYGDVSQ